MRADWTASGACTSGSTAHPKGATRKVSGGAATTSTTSAEREGVMASERASQRAFFGVSALLFAASAAVTIVWCASMSAMGEMPMPGGWTMSMAWMRTPGQTWPGAAASFLGMWVVMMVAMMLPSLVPMLRRYRQAVGGTGETRLGRLSALVGVGYFFVWTVFGMAAFPLGVALAAVEMQQPALARAVPIAVGAVVLIAGFLQLTAWKARHLAWCREAPGGGRTLPADVGRNERQFRRQLQERDVTVVARELGVAVRAREHDILHHELDVDHAAAVVLQVERIAPVRVALEQLSPHGEHFLAKLGLVALHLQDRTSLGFKRRAHRGVAGAEARASQGLVLPRPCGFPLVSLECRDRAHHQAARPVGTKPQVGLEQDTRAGSGREPVVQALRKARVVLLRVLVRIVVEKDDVEV